MITNRKNKTYTLPFILMCLFVLTRPFFSLEFAANYSIASFTLMEAYGFFSALLTAAVILLSPSPKRLGLINLLITCFVIYVLLSVFRGASLIQGIRFLLPFMMFYAARGALANHDQIRVLILLLMFSYIIPTVGSAVLIESGQSVAKEIYATGLIRYKGLYTRVHNLAHSMTIFCIFLILYKHMLTIQNIKRLFYLLSGYGLALIALFNIYKSAVRTVMVGLFIFICAYLYSMKKYLALTGLVFAAFVAFLFTESAQTIFFDIIQPLEGDMDASKMGSGRLGGWMNLLNSFFGQSIEIQFLGVGMGNMTKGYMGAEHNDLLALLTNLGYIGFILYFSVIIRMLIDISVVSRLGRESKVLFFGFITATMLMNFASNSYISRFDMGQYFFLICGIFYSLAQISSYQERRA